MATKRIFSLLLGWSFLMAAAATAADFEIKLPECQDAVLVSLPDGSEAGLNGSDKKWPAVFYHHGTNGKPRTDWMRSHTGSGDWIVVAMAYVQRGASYAVTAESLKLQMAAMQKVRDQLVAGHSLDPARVYVCGLSKGGWMCDHLLQADRTLAGGAILMAGHILDLPKNPKPYRKGLPIFIGIGRKDGNYPFSLRALQFHRKLGATVHMEDWPGLVHQVPQDGSTGLREWLAIQVGKAPDADALDREYADIVSLDRVERWWQLTRFKQRPAVSAEGSRWGAKTAEALSAIKDDPAVKQAAALYLEHRKLQAREITGRSVPEMEKVLHDYLQLSAKAAGSVIEEGVTVDLERVQKVMKNVAEQRGKTPAKPPARPEVTPNFPDDRRRIPANPLIR